MSLEQTPGDSEDTKAWHASHWQRVGHDLVTEQHVRWMKPRAYFTESVSSYKEKNKYHINAYRCNLESWKWMSSFSGQQWKYRHREPTCGHRKGEREWVEERRQ